MASIQARHHPRCALGNGKWRFKKLGTPGCTCPRGEGPVYHSHHRDPLTAKPTYEYLGKDKEAAKRALRHLEARLDEARQLAKIGARPRVRQDTTFEKWATDWMAGLTCKENSRRSYVSSIEYAKATFGSRVVRTLDVSDIQALLATIREINPKVSDSTLAKHLRVVAACLAAAVPQYADGNPVRALHRTQRPRPPAESHDSYFTDAELTRLWAELPREMPAAVFTHVCKAAVATGLRQGELLALRWGDVSLGESEVAVRRSYAYGIGEMTPKNGKTRIVDLTPPALGVFVEWAKVCGTSHDMAALVFATPDGRHLVGSTITREVLYAAMARAGISREGEHGHNRNFHSFRHTFARISLQGGAELSWLQRQLGHSSITVTVNRYGRWERKAEKLQALALETAFAGLF